MHQQMEGVLVVIALVAHGTQLLFERLAGQQRFFGRRAAGYRHT